VVASLTRHNMGLIRLQRNEKSVLDKVEDMDIDNQSDQEGVCLGEANVAATSSNSSSTSSTSELIRGKSVKNKGYKKFIVGQEVIDRFRSRTRTSKMFCSCMDMPRHFHVVFDVCV
jgi:hypothetical protein